MSEDAPVTIGGPESPPKPPRSEGEGAPPAAAETPRPKRKKRRRRADPEAATSAAEAGESQDGLAGEIDETVPAFARAWPRDAALDALVAAFEAGDYARVRREAPRLAKRTDDDAVRRAARELRRRLDPDPIAVYMLMAAAALLVFLAGWYWLHPHTP